MAIHGMLMSFALSILDIILLFQDWVSVLYIAVIADFAAVRHVYAAAVMIRMVVVTSD